MPAGKQEIVGLTLKDRAKVIDLALRRQTGRETIRELREEIGLSQQQLSQLLGVNTSTICRWESPGPTGRNPPMTAVAIISLLALEAAHYAISGATPLLAYLQSPINADKLPPLLLAAETDAAIPVIPKHLTE